MTSFSQFGRRIWIAYQEGLLMTCPAHRECAGTGQIAARDAATAAPAGFRPAMTAPAAAIDGLQDDVAAALQLGSQLRH